MKNKKMDQADFFDLRPASREEAGLFHPDSAELVGRVTFASGERQEFTDPEAYLQTIREELPYRNTTGFRHETLTDDPAIRKAVDDILLDFAGEENPRRACNYGLTEAGKQALQDAADPGRPHTYAWFVLTDCNTPEERLHRCLSLKDAVQIYRDSDCQEKRIGVTKDDVATVDLVRSLDGDHIDDSGTFHVRWDNGWELGVTLGEDRFSVYLPEPTTLKLYIPLTADFYSRDEWGDYDEIGETWDGRTLVNYEGQILGALVRNRMPEERERGLMHWYEEQDSVYAKVRSVEFTAEVRERQLWGVAECRVIGELSPQELTDLKDFITGQAADGWGEGMDLERIRIDGGELYVHLWNSGDWSIQPEQERFGLEEQHPEMGGMTLG